MTSEAVAGGQGPAEFRIGRVLSVSLSVLLRNFVPFIVLSLICSIPRIVYSYENPALQRILGNTDAMTMPTPGATGQRLGIMVLSLVLSMLCYAVTQSALIYGTVQDLSGRRAGFGEIVSRGFAHFFPVVGAALLMTLGIALGAVLLVVPAFILLTMWWVTIPVLVTERVGIGAAFGRSRQLTAGRRWAIFGLFLLVGVIQQVLVYLIGAVAGAVFGLNGGGINSFVASALIGGLILGFISSAYLAVMSAVGYYYLRAEKEGIAIGDIARVFD